MSFKMLIKHTIQRRVDQMESWCSFLNSRNIIVYHHCSIFLLLWWDQR